MENGIENFKDNRCFYCHTILSEWHSEWGTSDRQHYKSINCSCGKKNWLLVDFFGSGHDRFTRKFSLESALKPEAAVKVSDKSPTV